MVTAAFHPRVVYTVTINCDKKIITLIKYIEKLILLVKKLRSGAPFLMSKSPLNLDWFFLLLRRKY